MVVIRTLEIHQNLLMNDLLFFCEIILSRLLKHGKTKCIILVEVHKTITGDTGMMMELPTASCPRSRR